MAGIKNRMEFRGTRQSQADSARRPQHGPPVLLRLPKVRIDAPHGSRMEKQFTAMAEAVPADLERFRTESFESRPETQSQPQATPTSAPTEQRDLLEEKLAPAKKSWIDDWTNGVIIFLVAVVVFTTAILAIRSPSFNLTKWIPSAKPENKTQVAETKTTVEDPNKPSSSSELAATEPARATPQAPVALMAEKPVQEIPSRITQPMNNSNSTPPSSEIKLPTDAPSLDLSPSDNKGSDLIDLSSKPGDTDSSSKPQDEQLEPSSLEITSNESFQPSDIAGADSNDPSYADTLATSNTSGVTETQYAESNIEQLLGLLRQQRGLPPANGASESMARTSLSGPAAQMVSAPMGMPMPNQGMTGQSGLTQPNMNNSMPRNGQPSGMIAAPNQGFAPSAAQRTPYQQVLPGLMQEMNGGQQFPNMSGMPQPGMAPPTMAQPGMMQPGMMQPLMGQPNVAPQLGPAPARTPYVPIGATFQNPQ